MEKFATNVKSVENKNQLKLLAKRWNHQEGKFNPNSSFDFLLQKGFA